MNGRIFVDSNIFIYAHDLNAGKKYTVASKWVSDLWANHRGIVSTQVHDKLSFWDAMIVSAAFQAGAGQILSEDLNAGQTIA